MGMSSAHSADSADSAHSEHEDDPRREHVTPTDAPTEYNESRKSPRPDLEPGKPAFDVKIEPSWKRQLVDEFSQQYMQDLRGFLKKEIDAGKKIFPKPSEWFAAFDH